jgi:hypothetical protein
MAHIKTLFYLHLAANSHYRFRAILLYDALYEAGARDYKKSITEAFSKLLGFPYIASAAVDAINPFRSQLGGAIGAPHTLRHKYESIISWNMEKLLSINIISKTNSDIINDGTIRPD